MRRQALLRADVWTALLAVGAALFVVQLYQPRRAHGRTPVPAAAPLDSSRATGAAFGRSGEVRLLFALPGETIELAVELLADDTAGVAYEWTSIMGIETIFSPQPLLSATLFVPSAPGFYYLTLVRGEKRQIIAEPKLAVMRPFEEKSGTMLNGYRIGTYLTEKLLSKRSKDCPAGFLEVYPQHLDLAISKHFRVRDFITHDDQARVWPKYIALRPRLLDKLELVIAELSGGRSREDSVAEELRLAVHSGFRTPAHNKRVRKAARDSRHQYGDAADIAVDANRNGRMDRTDWRLLVTAVDAVEKSHPDLVGGLGVYNSRKYSSPYVHIDVRGKRSRWRG
jgi:hypothetical protein